MPCFDYCIKTPENSNLRVLLLTDIQIINSANQRRPDRLTDTEKKQWAPDTKEKNCYRYIKELVKKSSPDVIFMCGDFVYGEFDDEGKVLAETIDFMDGFNIPYATCLGNHERDSKIGADKQCKMLEKGKNSLFKKGKLSGEGNFSIAIKNGDKLIRVVLFLDSQPFGSGGENGFAPDQIEWIENICQSDIVRNGNVPVSLIYHAQMRAIRKSLEKYGFPENKNFELKGYEGEFGYIGASLKGNWDKEYTLFYHLRDLGVDSHFFGHEHCNSAGVLVDGVRMQYVLKSSTYDRSNYLEPDGNIIQSFVVKDKPIIGGTYMEIGNNSGEISKLKHIYCDVKQE